MSKRKLKQTPDEETKLLIINLRRVLRELELRYDVPKTPEAEGGWDFVERPRSADETHYHPNTVADTNAKRQLKLELTPAKEFVKNFNKRRVK